MTSCIFIILVLGCTSSNYAFLTNLSIFFFSQMMGKELTGLSLKELQHLEHQLTEGILSVKDRKVLTKFKNLNIYVQFCYFIFIKQKQIIWPFNLNNALVKLFVKMH